MSDSRGRQARRGVQLLGATLAAGLLLLSVVLPALAAAVGPTKLEHPSVDPRTGSTTTQFTLRVTYRSNQSVPPEYVRVVVGSTTYEMTGAGTDWKGGVVFTVVTSLPAGAMGVVFQARDAEKFVDEADGGAVTVTQAPTPVPTPTPAPTPTPLPTPTPTANSTTGGTAGDSTTGGSGPVDGAPIGTPGATGGSDTGGSSGATAGRTSPHRPGFGELDGRDVTAGGTSGGSARGGISGPGPSGSGPFGSGTSGSGAPGSGTDGAGSSGPVPGPFASGSSSFGTSGSGISGAGSGSGSTGSGTSGQSDSSVGGGANPGGSGSSSGLLGDPFASWLDAPSGAGIAELGLSGGGRLPTLPAMMVSTTAVVTWMAFTLFKRRRQDEEPPGPELVLQRAAAAGAGVAPGAGYAPPVDLESQMPRWRRPSLIDARRIDPIRSVVPERPRLAFGYKVSNVVEGLERRPIRHAVTSLLDRPDEIHGLQIGDLVEGDEVQVEGRQGAYCEVACPDGQRGWVHRTTLGPPIATDAGRWSASDAEGPAEAENALAALIAARGLQAQVR